MTEQEWLQFSATDGVFDYLRANRFSTRKARLFAVACCRTLGPWLSETVCHTAVDRSEQFADGGITKQALAESRKDFPAEKHFSSAPNANIAALPTHCNCSLRTRG